MLYVEKYVRTYLKYLFSWFTMIPIALMRINVCSQETQEFFF